MTALEFWKGDFGDEYTERNAGSGIEARVALWDDILGCVDAVRLDDWPGSILEIGAGNGNNLEALRRLGRSPLSGVEPNASACAMLKDAGFGAFEGTAEDVPIKYCADLVFTYGVLIHIPPEELAEVCADIYGLSNEYIVCIEYFASQPEEKVYRGHSGRLWKRDFGGFWLDNFDLEVLGCGFAWKRMTGLDDLTWWAFRKCA